MLSGGPPRLTGRTADLAAIWRRTGFTHPTGTGIYRLDRLGGLIHEYYRAAA
jgi:hypothetical protein